ncbi:alpha/beta hydrolase [Streptomyces nitrosporeus]|uniref:Alpha/beta hydrolase n=1 Tax=Streptomyces nitrosporeus TaxID=28894 RepID=A0A5J6F822_9ACTN|nr:alpha/beta hydrolase [Streptomyces nitrosporeus]QEU72471.1 alpha/beta hydrolase [Streptomyces nitrosporeus]GGY77644.1 peptidase [Streptomyces nitrosporeus]
MRTPPALRATALAATATVLLPLAACSGGDDGGTDRARPSAASTASPTATPRDLASQKLSWKRCSAPSEAQGSGTAPSPLPGGTAWECAFMDVPLDYGDPGGRTIELALVRARAKERDERIGSLVFNFGGPGASGVATLPSFGTAYDALRTRYDLVSFDPRGVGRSEGVVCSDDEALDARYQMDGTPDSPEEEKAFVEDLKSYTADCEKNSGEELPYVGTVNAARDMDLLRQVLGDDELYYFGISYGTELGGVYAHLFPRKVGRAVLDAVVDPTEDAEQSSLGQAEGFQLALDNFTSDCAERDDCRLTGSTSQEVEEWIAGLLAKLEKEPVPGLGERKLTQTQATTGIAASLYSQETWPLLEQGLDEADGGNGGLLLALADSLNGRSQDGRYDNSNAANTAVNCADSAQRFDLERTKAALPAFREASPVFGDYLGWGLMSCTGWPVAGTWKTPDVSAPGAAPVLVIGNTGDPATPYAGAKAMAGELGEGVGVELTYKGEGHGAYNAGNSCVQKAVDGYLLDGKVPAAGTVCE